MNLYGFTAAWACAIFLASARETSAQRPYACAAVGAVPIRAMSGFESLLLAAVIAVNSSWVWPSTMVRMAARATATYVMAGSMRASRILVFNKSSPLATLAFMGQDRCDAHHRIAVSTPSFVAAMCCDACLVIDEDGSTGVSRTAA